MLTRFSIIISPLLIISAVPIFAKVLRNEDGSFRADFFQAAVGKRQPSILAIFKSTKINDCYYKCVQHLECEAINHHENEAVCELTNHRYDDVTMLVEGSGFTYYDSSDSCDDNPCFAFADCANIDEFPGFQCKCKKDYTGLRCDKLITKEPDKSTPSTEPVVTTKQNAMSTVSAVTTTKASKTTAATGKTTTTAATTTAATTTTPESESNFNVIQSAELLLDTKNQIIVPFECFGKEYIIDLNYRKEKTALLKYRNLINLSDSKGRVILMLKVLNNQIMVQHATGLESNVINVDMRRYIWIRIKQVQARNGKYHFTLFINGRAEYKVDLSSADIYFNAVLYVSGFGVFKGYIKDFVLFREMEQTVLQDTQKQISEDQLLTTLKTMEKEYVIIFEYMNKNSKEMNIIHFTATRSDSKRYGSHIIDASLLDKGKKMKFRFDLNGKDIQQEYEYSTIDKNVWYKFRIQQVKDDNGRYEYSIFVNDVSVHSRENTAPQIFHGVSVYAANKWFGDVKGDAFIRNFSIYQSGACRNILCEDGKSKGCYNKRHYGCSCDKDKGFFKNGDRCKRNCLIEVLETDETNLYFYFDSTHLTIISHGTKLNVFNPRNKKSEEVFVWIYKQPGKQKSGNAHGRAVSKNPVWKAGDLLFVVDKELCPTGVEWSLQQEDVKFGAKNDAFGEFALKKDGLLYSIKLVHKSGFVACRSTGGNSNWGCRQDKIALFITNSNNKLVLPRNVNVKDKGYEVQGFTSMSPELPFHTVSDPIKVETGLKYRIWFGEDLLNNGENDNPGTAKADVYAIII